MSVQEKMNDLRNKFLDTLKKGAAPTIMHAYIHTYIHIYMQINKLTQYTCMYLIRTVRREPNHS